MQPVGYRGILHTSTRLFCQVLSKSSYSFVYSLYSSSLSRNKLLFSCPAHRERKSLFCSCLCHFPLACQWDKLPCLFSYLAFFPSCQSFSLTKVVWQTLSVIQQLLNSLFISLACSAILTYYRKGRLAVSTAGSINLKITFQKTFGSLFVLFSPCNSGYTFAPFYCFVSILCIFKLAAFLVQGRNYYKEEMRRMLIKFADSCCPQGTAVFVHMPHGMGVGCRH